jgi:hypothetical protein
VVGLYETRDQAEAIRARLMDSGWQADQLRIFEPGRPGDSVRADSDDVLKEMLREGTIGTAVGTVAGAAGTLALAAANVSLFVASPVRATLAMLGWGAGLGGLVGAIAGADNARGDVADLVRDALAGGSTVLVAFAATEDQAIQARDLIGVSMAEPPAPAAKSGD